MFTCVTYGLEVIPLNVSDLRSLDFIINQIFTMLFKTHVMDAIKVCQDYIGFHLHSVMIEKRSTSNENCYY